MLRTKQDGELLGLPKANRQNKNEPDTNMM